MTARRSSAWGAATTVLLCATAGGIGVAQSASAQESDCASLADLALENVRIDLAEAIDPDPVWPFPPSLISQFLPPDAGVRAPFCRVVGTIEEEIGFEVWLPEGWNGRLEATGNSAYIGDFVYPGAAAALERGAAAATSDLGHKSKDQLETTWAIGRRDRIENYGHRAHHLLAATAKAIVLAYYGRPQDYAYFNGCSAGGWQGLTEASLYPEDYDGVLAGAPANNLIRANTTGLWREKHSLTTGRLAPEAAALVARAAVARCDADDGVTDGIVGAPETCAFDPEELLCEASEAAGQCLTPAQVERARFLHGPRSTAGGLALYPGFAWGTVIQDVLWNDYSQTLPILAEPDHAWSPETFDFDRDVPPLEAELGRTLGRTDPDLSAFAAAGGKIILYHGWTDGVISPYNTVEYWASVQNEMGGDAVESFARLYMAPGMNHCGGGPGPDRFDALALLEAWVERGEAPGRLIASKLGPDGEPTVTRPLCPYPQVAVHDGEGDPDAAESFRCEAP